MARRIFLTLAVPFLALLTLFIPSLPARARGAPRVLAFYYAWFDDNTWTRDLVSDLPALTYRSSDPAAIARHISQAQAAGVDTFVASWTGTNNPTDSNFRTLLRLAQGVGFQATLDFEVQSFGNRDGVASALAYVRDQLMPSAAFMREGGKPVVFFWREQNLSIADWSAIRQAVDPNHQQIWIAEGVDISYQQVFDGHHLYSIAWSPNPSATLNDWANRVRGAGDKLWVATVMPGYDDTRTARPDRFARNRAGGDFYRSTWQAAINSRPDWIIITSFNEWVEGTQIEPSVSYGNLYLDLTLQFSRQFKSGSQAPQPAVPAIAAAPKTTVRPAPVPTRSALGPDERTTTDIVRVRAGPGTDFEILGRVRADRTVKLLGRSMDARWLAIAFPDEAHPGWIAAQFVAPAVGLRSLPVIDAPTQSGSVAPDACPAPGLLPFFGLPVAC